VNIPAQKPVLAALLMCGSTICFTFTDTVVKALVVHHGIAMLVTIRVCMQFLLMLLLMPWFGLRLFRLRNPAVQIGRGVTLIVSSALSVASLRYVPLAQAMAIVFSAPLLAALAAMKLFGERLHWRQAVCILAGFGGVVAALDPGTPTFGPALLWPLALAVAVALMHILTRMGRDDDPLASVLWPGLVGSLISACGLPWTFETLPWPAMGIMILGCIAVTIGQFLMVEAFRRAPTAVVSPIIYVQFIWSVISGVLVFGEMPGIGVVAGAVVVSLSGITLILWATPKPPAAT
jgi:drug/metabolite transporter (DMT)-like permease